MSEKTLPELVDADTGRILAAKLELATTFWQRFWGWQFRAPPPAGTALLIAPCNSIHTFWMRFAIDVAFLDERGRVVALRSRVIPWRIVLPVAGAKAALETPASQCPVAIGQRLAIASIDQSALAQSVRFLAAHATNA